ncbi:MAG: hypothetical protein L0Z53_18695 [Acidobacteriales bacterium]|nr:hypothetical protein [Terriglobales bacterium]
MREQWYADNRDLVKWARLVQLARRNGVQTILQIGMIRPNKAEWQRATREFPSEVLAHFRGLGNIQSLGTATQLEIRLVASPFRAINGHGNKLPWRDAYFAEANRKLAEFKDKKVIAFLDPDTGLEPGKAGPKHIRRTELRLVYDALKPHDWLALYQHAPRIRKGNSWIGTSRGKFSSVLDVSPKRVETLSAPEIADDVVLFALEKGTPRA